MNGVDKPALQDLPVWVYRFISGGVSTLLLGLLLWNAGRVLQSVESTAITVAKLQEKMTQVETRMGAIEDRLHQAERQIDALRGDIPDRGQK